MSPSDLPAFELGVEWGIAPTISPSDLSDALTDRLAWMMKHDYERLLNALYLLDLSEAKFREATQLATNAQKARALAALVLEREAEKAESRRRYRQARSTDIPATPPDDRTLD